MYQLHPWNRLISSLPDAHVLQSWEWGQVKSLYGWQTLPITWDNDRYSFFSPPSGRGAGRDPSSGGKQPDIRAAAMLLQRAIPAGGFAQRMRILYIPKGPLLDWSDPRLRERILDNLASIARKQGAIFIKIDPDIPLGRGIPGQPGAVDDPLGVEITAELLRRGWRFSSEQVQFRNTVQIDLTQTEDQLLARMKGKTRYNIRLAERKGVTVRPGTTADLDLLYGMYAETSLRDGFVIRAEDYYRAVWSTFLANYQGLSSPTLPNQTEFPINGAIPVAEPLIAEVEGEAVAAVVIFRFAGKAWYLHGMSRSAHREKMPNVLLQWQAIRHAKTAGCKIYDLWGAPDTFDEQDSMWGVFRFKEGLGGEVLRTIGAWDLPVRPIIYRLFTQTLPRLLAVMRRRGRLQTQQSIQ